MLVVYHNRAGETAGWIRHSVTKARTAADGGRQPTATTLADALGIQNGSRHYYRFRDLHSGQHYLRSGAELFDQGLFLQLGGYQYQVFVDFAELVDEDGLWGQLCQQLGGRPVADLDRELKRLRLAPLLLAFDQLLQLPALSELPRRLAAGDIPAASDDPALAQLCQVLDNFALQLQLVATPHQQSGKLTRSLSKNLARDLKSLGKLLQLPATASKQESRAALVQAMSGTLNRVLPAYLLLHRLGDLQAEEGSPARTAAWLDDYLLREPLEQLVAGDQQLLLIALIRQQGLLPGQESRAALFDDPTVRACLHVHDYQDRQWLCGERLAELTFGLFVVAALNVTGREDETEGEVDRQLECLWQQAQQLLAAGEQAGYRLDRLRALL
ncbi:MAG: hypothetical protein R2864_07435 [Syntrophotaleaceae bacterium]